jgi:hypothetical protein
VQKPGRERSALKGSREREPLGYQEARLRRNLGEVLGNRLMDKACCMGLTAAHSGQGESHKGRRKMTTNGHEKGSKESHKHMGKSAKEVGKGNMSDEEFDREMVELKKQISVINEFLQESDEDHRCRWTMRKKVKWNIFYVKMKHRLNAWLRKEELGATEMRLHYCEPKQGSIFGEDEDGDTNEIQESHVFEINTFFVNTSSVGTRNE